jgi:triosephosphate isomerase (TIM)
MGGHRKLIIGNWKMNFTVKQAVAFAEKLTAKEVPEGITVALGPHSLALHSVAEMVSKSDLKISAQNAYFQDEGAFTGEISMPMLRGEADFVLIGHSERRHVFHESQELIRHKVAAAIRSGITPVLCVGETLVEREHYHTNQVLNDQLTTGLADLTSEEVAKLVIAYEPVWAIGTGKFASPEDVESAVQKIRQVIGSLYGTPTAEKVRVLYGGSVSPDNAKAYLNLEGINGLLVGGASLSLHTFWPIVEKAAKAVPKKIEVKK